MNEKPSIKRALLPELVRHLEQKEVTLLIGPRQAGKTTLMRFLQEECISRKAPTLFLSLDSEQDAKFFSSQQMLLDRMRLEFGGQRGYVFLDEIQRKENAGLFLKGLYDMDLPYKLIVSGSGSIDLKAKVRESLAGRKLIFEVYPLTFHEFADFRTGYHYSDRLADFFSIDALYVARLRQEYLRFGGYPRVVLADTIVEKQRMIDEIYRSYIEKDISSLLRVERLDAFRDLVVLLASQSGQIVSYAEVSSTLAISFETVRNYLWYLEETYVIARVTPYFRNKRKEIVKSPVIYFNDLGLRNYSVGSFDRDFVADGAGFPFQNLVYLLLRELTRYRSMRVQYWRTKDGTEVDFVIESATGPTPLEVKSGIFHEEKIPRSLRSFIEHYHPKYAYIVTKEFSGSVVVGDTQVDFLPFYKLPMILH